MNPSVTMLQIEAIRQMRIGIEFKGAIIDGRIWAAFDALLAEVERLHKDQAACWQALNEIATVLPSALKDIGPLKYSESFQLGHLVNFASHVLTMQGAPGWTEEQKAE